MDVLPHTPILSFLFKVANFEEFVFGWSEMNHFAWGFSPCLRECASGDGRAEVTRGPKPFFKVIH
jgi:hypothetical protein